MKNEYKLIYETPEAIYEMMLSVSQKPIDIDALDISSISKDDIAKMSDKDFYRLLAKHFTVEEVKAGLIQLALEERRGF